MRLCDTDVLVDLVRGYAPAMQWFQTLGEPAGVAGIAYMEVIAGCANKSEVARVHALLTPLPVCWTLWLRQPPLAGTQRSARLTSSTFAWCRA